MNQPVARLTAAFAVVAALAAVATAGTRESALAPTPTPCRTTTLRPAVDENGATGMVFLYAVLRNTTRHTCTVHGRMTLALRDAKTRRLLSIVGNPTTAPVHARLHPGRNTVFALLWKNYCGPGRPLVVTATYGRRTAAFRDSWPGANCGGADKPSTLRLFRPPR